MAENYSFTVSNEDITIRFSCPNHSLRISEIVENLCSSDSGPAIHQKKYSRFAITEGAGTFIFNGAEAEGDDIREEAAFFENTDYPLIVRGAGGKTLTEVSLSINDRLRSDEGPKSTIVSDNGELFGSINFRNQVGMTDFTVTYKVNGERHQKKLSFMTEVLSYKLDYRSDLRTIISDIENEYAMLCTAFLKDTYLSIRSRSGESNQLIWWQIFKSCHKEIISAAKQIIDRPKRRLRSVARYERAERLMTLPRELENEYTAHRDNPAHLYRTEEMILSHDTIENRFLKYAVNEMAHRFMMIKEHIITAMHLDNPMLVDTGLEEMEANLLRLRNHQFFRGVGTFKGFSQDNLVMKQAHGYKTILEKWVELQQGYELEEGLRKLEVKDISDLYEIWCFIKVKNIVDDTLRELGKQTKPTVNGRLVSKEFIPQLVYGGSMSFIDTDGIELACVSYNSQVEKAGERRNSAISGTDSMTTAQRPDIVLRLSRTSDSGMKYTYLFDAKYRIDDRRIDGKQVPPEDAINQMHRYRDAIYYTEDGKDRSHLKKEIIAGYVLFPGTVPPEALDLESGDYCYQKSNRSIGIGAFPLKPDRRVCNKYGELKVDPHGSERTLRAQIRKWLEEENPRETLLERSIPQKGLEYSDEPVARGTYFLHNIDPHVNPYFKDITDGTASQAISGYNAILSGIDYQKVRYFVPVDNHTVKGYYEVAGISPMDASEQLNEDKSKMEASGKTSRYNGYDKPLRIKFVLGKYTALPQPFTYGIDRKSSKGTTLTRAEFNEYKRNALKKQ